MRLLPRRRSAGSARTAEPMQRTAAYAVCRSISRAAARNFYYAFLALPREKRDAICAVYAFMRHADDVSDDPALGAAEKRARLADWLDRFRCVLAGAPTDEPVLLAIADTQHRYAIPPALLEALVEGTATDLEPETPVVGTPALVHAAAPVSAAEAGQGSVAGGERQVASGVLLAPYRTFDDLYGYCYQVASVVGLICIRIFGYYDPAAEPLAERCGIAFQLTNIIRDVPEDAGLGRVYLPHEDLERFGCSPADVRASSAAERLRSVLEFEAARARDFYRAADELLPLIDDDSRPGLWVLVTIYRRLLDKIAARNYDVFSEKVRLSALEKLRVLAKGLWLRVI